MRLVWWARSRVFESSMAYVNESLAEFGGTEIALQVPTHAAGARCRNDTHGSSDVLVVCRVKTCPSKSSNAITYDPLHAFVSKMSSDSEAGHAERGKNLAVLAL